MSLSVFNQGLLPKTVLVKHSWLKFTGPRDPKWTMIHRLGVAVLSISHGLKITNAFLSPNIAVFHRIFELPSPLRHKTHNFSLLVEAVEIPTTLGMPPVFHHCTVITSCRLAFFTTHCCAKKGKGRRDASLSCRTRTGSPNVLNLTI